MSDDRRTGEIDRREGAREDHPGRRAYDRNGWSVQFIANSINMSEDFVRSEIKNGNLVGSKFGKNYRVTTRNLLMYYQRSQWPVPQSVRESLKLHG